MENFIRHQAVLQVHLKLFDRFTTHSDVFHAFLSAKFNLQIIKAEKKKKMDFKQDVRLEPEVSQGGRLS